MCGLDVIVGRKKLDADAGVFLRFHDSIACCLAEREMVDLDIQRSKPEIWFWACNSPRKIAVTRLSCDGLFDLERVGQGHSC